MNWNEIVKLTATRSARPSREVDMILQTFLTTVGEQLVSDPTQRIVLRSLGTLSGSWATPRVLRSPRDQRRLYIDGRWRVRFRVAEALRTQLEARSPQLWRAPGHQAAWRMAEALVGDANLYHTDACPTVAGGASDAEVHAAALAALGMRWQRIVRAYEQEVPPEIRGEHDHLAAAARRWWHEGRDKERAPRTRPASRPPT